MTEHEAGASAPALRTDRLGRRYGRVWGLRDCTIEVPAGVVAGLVGPNGAGKTTLLEMVIGLLEPTEGQVSVFGESSHADAAARLARVGYVAQDHPLYRDFSVADMLHLGRAMNPSWDQDLATARMDKLGIPGQRKVKGQSGGQRAQVELTMALAKRAPLLVLDEPVSSLDPVARLELMRDVMAEAAGTGLTVLIASHVVSELERLCDWLIILTGGHVQLARAEPTICSPRTGCSPSPAPPGTLRFPGSPSTAPTATGTPPCWSAPARPGWRRGSTPAGRPTRWASSSSSWPTCSAPLRRRPQTIPPRPPRGPGLPARR